MRSEESGYFRFKKRKRVHYVDEAPGGSTLRTLCGRDTFKTELIPASIEAAEKSLCRTCRKVIDTEFWGWEQML